MSVYANGRSILHEGAGNTHVCAVPDVCKTPTPGGPVPIPYINVAKDGDLAKGAKKTQIEGRPVALKSSHLKTSVGDEAGTAGGGVVSSKTKGKMTWASASGDVKIEGKGVCRFLDATLHNGNTSNCALAASGETGLYYGDDELCKAYLEQAQRTCGKERFQHRVPETEVIQAKVGALFVELDKVLNEQRPTIEEARRLRAEHDAIWERDTEAVERLEAELDRMAEEEQAFRARSPTQEEVKAFNRAHKPAESQTRSARREASRTRQRHSDENRKAVEAAGKRLAPVHVLRKRSGVYDAGYMTGAIVCHCGDHCYGGCSGAATPGFGVAIREVSGMGFVSLPDGPAIRDAQKKAIARALSGGSEDGWQGAKWKCAAPKLMEQLKGPHRPGAMSERLYDPFLGYAVKVSYAKADQDGHFELNERGAFIKTRETFGHGDSVPSCANCQALLPEYLCENGPCDQ